MPRITPNLWFDDKARRPPSSTSRCSRTRRSPTSPTTARPAPGEPARCSRSSFELDGTPFTIINGGPQFTFDEADLLRDQLR